MQKTPNQGKAMAKRQRRAYGIGSPFLTLNPEPVVSASAPTSSDKNFEVGQLWIDQSTDATYTLVKVVNNSATWALNSPGASDVDQLTGDSGTATPSGGSIEIKGGSGITTSAAGAIVTINASAGEASVTPYVVAADGSADYTTIQAAINAANAAGGGVVVLRPGTYTEDLTLYDNIQVVGAIGLGDTGDFTIAGTHTPPASGGVVFRNVYMTDAAAIFSSAAAGSTHIILADARVGVVNGHTFDLANWTGTIECWDVNPDLGTNDGWLNNTGGATLLAFSAGMGAGTGQSMTVSGPCIVGECEFNCPLELVTGATSTDIVGTTFNEALTLSNNSAGVIKRCDFATGASAAITMSSSGNWDLDLLSMDSSNSPCLDGAGAGTLTYGVLSFLDNSEIAATLTTSRQEMSTGTAFATTFDTDVAAAASTLTATTWAADGTDANIGMTVSVKGTGTLALANQTTGVTVEAANGVNTVAQTVSIANGASAGDSTVNILSGDATSGTLAVNIGNGAGGKTVNICNGVEGSTVTIGNGINTTAQTVSIANGAAAADSTVSILSGDATAGTQTLNLGNGAGTKAVNVATGVEGNTVNIGTGINTSAQVVNVSSGAAAADSTVNILTGIATAGTQTLNMASAASDTAVNMGTGAAVKTVTIGSTDTTSTTTINAGSGGVQLVGDVDLTTGSLAIEGAGQRLAVEGGAATDFIGTATLSSGTVTVAHTGITAADRVFVCRQDLNSSTEAGVLEAVVTASTNFVINSRDPSDATIATNDNSIVAYWIVRQL